MRWSEPGQLHLHAAQIDRVVALEHDVRARIGRAFHQFGKFRRTLFKQSEERGAELLHILLLGKRAHELEGGRKGDAAGRVLGVKMRGRNVNILVAADLRHFAQHRLAVADAETGVDDERGAAADNDADIRHYRHEAVRNHPNMLGHLDRGALLDQRHRQRRLRPRACCNKTQ